MATEISKIMTIIDNNSEKLNNGDYLNICNLLMNLREKIIPSKSVPDTDLRIDEIRRLRGEFWRYMSDERKIDVLLDEIEITDISYFMTNLNLKELQQMYLEEHNKLDVSIGEQVRFLNVLYDRAMRNHNLWIQNQINEHERILWGNSI